MLFTSTCCARDDRISGGIQHGNRYAVPARVMRQHKNSRPV
jgi:hypothetical protein